MAYEKIYRLAGTRAKLHRATELLAACRGRDSYIYERVRRIVSWNWNCGFVVLMVGIYCVLKSRLFFSFGYHKLNGGGWKIPRV